MPTWWWKSAQARCRPTSAIHSSASQAFKAPIPLTTAPQIPEIALFKRELRQGVAKLAITAYDADDGSFIASTSPKFGYSHRTRWVLLLFINWTTSDLIPESERDPQDFKLLPWQ